MKKVCHCGTCDWCQAKQRVLDFAAQRQWAAFEWTVCSTICSGEKSWRIFADAHDLTELRWVLRVAEERRPKVLV
jgi:hypothetical protein